MESNFSGLPMLRLGSGIPAAPPPPPPLHTDPATNLQAASFDVSPSFTRVPLTGVPAYYKANNGVQSTPRRPLEPLVSVDVTEPAAVGVAHGAFLRALGQNASDETLTAIFSQVITDTSSDQTNLSGVTAFPSKPQSISTFTGITGLRQTLNLIAGVFRSTAPTFGVNGVQRNFSRLAGDVFYSNSNDWTPPTLGELEAVTVPNTTNFGFAIDATDAPGTVKAVNVIYRDCAGTWRTVDLANASGTRWTGSGPAGGSCTSVDYYVQAADGAGNVAVSSKKAQVELVTVPQATGGLGGGAIDPNHNPPQQPVNGWYKTTPISVTLTGGSSLKYSLDKGPFQDYTGPISVPENGLHTVDGQTKDGSATTQVAFGIDTQAPTITVNAPANGATYSVGQQVKIDYYCSDSGSGIASGCTSTPAKGTLLNTSAPGTYTFTVQSAVDNVSNSSGDKTVTYTVGYRKVLFTSTRTGNGDIYSMNLNGTGVLQLTNNAAIDAAPVYSPDGQRIISTSTRPGSGDIYAMNTDGTGVVQLTNSTGVEALGEYSPNGRKIVYTSTVAGHVEIYVMNADGTGQTRLTTNPAIDADPTWSPDGTKIAFASNRIGTSNYEIYTMSADGSNQL